MLSVLKLGSLRNHNGDAEDNVDQKRNLYFTCESRNTLKLFTLLISVKAITKLNLGHIDKSEIKINRRGSRSPDNTELDHFTLFCRGRQKYVPRIITYVHSYCFAY